MSKKRVVHYINQFFAGIGGEEKADIKPEIREGFVGPGMAINKAIDADAEIVATVICGDSYFNENLEEA
ncbi:glycine/betaine/sarcosine/D-proline family reductase selenoprotein B, partial [bacterium AH-315-G05]|nr:glycine/betaine/sarcosine/D-proline family reductase selenoprotein B [bacterium AH-315-G05]